MQAYNNKVSIKIQLKKKLTVKKRCSIFQCLGITKKGAKCSRVLRGKGGYCFQHNKKSNIKIFRAKKFDQFYTVKAIADLCIKFYCENVIKTNSD